MGRAVYAEEILLNYLKNLTTECHTAVGLIIGQSVKTKDYVIHLARTSDERVKLPESPALIKPFTFKSVKEIQSYMIANHAKHVMRMLPGGLNVLGLFICTSDNIFNDPLTESTLKKILLHLGKELSSEPYLYGHKETEKLILHFNPVDERYVCRALDVSNTVLGAFKSVDWTFQNKCTKWYQISSKFDMNWPSIGGKTSVQLKTQLKNFLMELYSLLDPAIVLIDGQFENTNKSLESIIKRKQNKDVKSSSEIEYLEASIFTSLKDSPNDEDIQVVDCDVELDLMGVLKSQVFINEKGTTEEAVNAVKQDIVRSLAARFEMHWDSLIEEEYGSPEEKQTIHEPPRRVSVSLPGSPLHFNDYIFPGETPNEVISTCKELLDIEITEENVDDEYEIHGDPVDLYGKSQENSSLSPANDMLNSTRPTAFLVGAISFAVILLGIAIALHMQRSASDVEKKS